MGILSDLTPAQHDGATREGPVLVIAGAGTGKTKTLTAGVVHRITKRSIPAARILAVTFTNKAAAEMTGRIQAALGDTPAPHWIGTYHGLGARQLRIEPEVAGLRPGFDILDADDSKRTLKRVMKAMNLATSDDEGAIVGRDPVKMICHRISKFKDELVAPEEAAAHVQGLITVANQTDTPIDTHGLRLTARIYVAYERALRDANAADFGDLLLWPVRAMQRHPEYRGRWAGRFDALLGDEYQDVNRAQYTWLRLLSRDHEEIMVVGDDDQAVYGWRGSDIAYIRQFTTDFARAAQIRLEENFRSTGHILAAANAVIAEDRARLGKTLFTKKQAGTRVEIVKFRNPDAEANGIVDEIQRLHAEGTGWGEIAILYRTNALSRGFEEALLHAQIPHILVGDVGFYQRAEIKDALALLRLCATPDDVQANDALRRVINAPARGFGPKAMDVLESEAEWRQVPLLAALETVTLPPRARSAGLAFADAIRGVARDTSQTLADQLSLLLDAAGYRAMLRDSLAETTEDRLENLAELIQLAGNFHTARELLDHASLATGGPDDDETARVRLMTLHKGKGLEFPHVFLPAWEAGSFPPNYGDPAEERRLAYVAITRGMRRVTITHCEFRRGFATPSPFLASIPVQNLHHGWLRPASHARPRAMRQIEVLAGGWE